MDEYSADLVSITITMQPALISAVLFILFHVNKQTFIWNENND